MHPCQLVATNGKGAGLGLDVSKHMKSKGIKAKSSSGRIHWLSKFII